MKWVRWCLSTDATMKIKEEEVSESIMRDIALILFFEGCGRQCPDGEMGTVPTTVWPLSPSVSTATVTGRQVCSPHLRDEESRRCSHAPRLRGWKGMEPAVRAGLPAAILALGMVTLRFPGDRMTGPAHAPRNSLPGPRTALLHSSTPRVCPLGVVRGSAVTPCASPVPGQQGA